MTSLLSPAYALYHFTETVENGKVHFDYLLKSGRMTTRNAIRILEINGYPQEIIREARETSLRISDGGPAISG